MRKTSNTTVEKRKLSTCELPYKAGIVFDSKKKLIGTYIYLTEKDQATFDAICQSWLDAYKLDKNFHLCIDLETSGLLHQFDTCDILLHAVTSNGKQAVVFEDHKLDMTLYKEVLNTIPLVNHNLKFDVLFLRSKLGVRPKVKFCTMVAVQLGYAGGWFEKKSSLDVVVKYLLPEFRMSKDIRQDFIGKPKTYGWRGAHIEYAARDCLLTYRLVPKLHNRLAAYDLLDIFYKTEMRLVEIFVDIESRGILIDVERLDAYLGERNITIYELQKEFNDIINLLDDNQKPTLPKSCKTGIYNPGSSPQVVQLLQRAYDIKTPSTDKEAMENLRGSYPDNRAIEVIQEFRLLQADTTKLLGAIKEKALNPKTGRINPTNFTHGTETGRFAVKEPAIHGTQPQHREMFIAGPGRSFSICDYSQFEFRVMAARANEAVLLDKYFERAEYLDDMRELAQKYGERDPDEFVKDALEKNKYQITPGERELAIKFARTDAHKTTASLIFDLAIEQVTAVQRQVSKSIGFGLLYGAGPDKTRNILAVKSKVYLDLSYLQEAQVKFFEKLPNITKEIEAIHKRVRPGKYLELEVGRKRFFNLTYKFDSLYKKELADAQRQSVNWYCQCSNAHATKQSIITLTDYYEENYEELIRPYIPINLHDELVVDGPDEDILTLAAHHQQVMIDCGMEVVQNRIPIEVSSKIAKTWVK